MSVISEKYLSEMLSERFDYKSNDIEVTVKERYCFKKCV